MNKNSMTVKYFETYRDQTGLQHYTISEFNQATQTTNMLKYILENK